MYNISAPIENFTAAKYHVYDTKDAITCEPYNDELAEMDAFKLVEWYAEQYDAAMGR